MTSMHQASYFPWQGLLNKISSSDTFILLDEVQFNDDAYQNRNIFLDKNLQTKMLTIALQKKNYLNKSIKEIKIADKRWQKKHLKFLMQNYNKHPFYEEILESIEPLYTQEYSFIIDVLVKSMQITFTLFNIDTQILKQSDLEYDKSMKKNDLIINLLQTTKSKKYLSGIGAKEYQDEALFLQNGIDLAYQNYQQITYKQFKNSSFVSGLSSLDLLFNVGKELAHKYIS